MVTLNKESQPSKSYTDQRLGGVNRGMKGEV